MIKEGDFVKIRIAPDLFWCEVLVVHKSNVLLRVDNDLLANGNHGVGYGDELIWPVSGVLEVWEDV